MTAETARERERARRARVLRPRRDRARTLGARPTSSPSTCTRGVGWVPANHALTPLGPARRAQPVRLDRRPAPAARRRHARARRTGDGGEPAASCCCATSSRPTARRGSAARGSFLREALRELEQELGARAAGELRARVPAAAWTRRRRCRSRSRRSGASSPFPARVMGALQRSRRRARALLRRVRAAPVRDPGRAGGGPRERRPQRRAQGGRARDRPPAKACARASCRCSTPQQAGNGVHIHLNLLDARGRLAALRRRGAGLPERARRALRRRDPAPRARAERADRRRARSPARAWRPTAGARERCAWRRATARRCCGSRRWSTLGRRRAAQSSCASSTAARTRPPTRTWRSGRSCGRGSTGVRAGAAGAADPRRATPRRSRREEAERFGVGALPASLEEALEALAADELVRGVDAAAALRRLRERQAGRARRRRRSSTSRSCAGAMPRSTDAAARAAAATAHRAASSPRAVELRHRLHAQPRAGARRAADRGERRRASCRSRAGASPGPGGSPRRSRARRTARPPVAVRAELDGLPIEERTGGAFSRRRARRCTPAGTTSTWPRWWR